MQIDDTISLVAARTARDMSQRTAVPPLSKGIKNAARKKLLFPFSLKAPWWLPNAGHYFSKSRFTGSPGITGGSLAATVKPVVFTVLSTISNVISSNHSCPVPLSRAP